MKIIKLSKKAQTESKSLIKILIYVIIAIIIGAALFYLLKSILP